MKAKAWGLRLLPLLERVRSSILSPFATESSFRASVIPPVLTALVLTCLAHEAWGDEAQAWFLARFSSGFVDLLVGDARAYEGHPFLWFWLLRAASKITTSYWGFALTGLTIAVANVTLLLTWRTLPHWLRLLFAGSYLIFFEYGVIVRNYGFAILILLVSLRLLSKRTSSPFIICGLGMGLMVNTYIPSIGIAAVVLIPVFLAPLRSPWRRRVGMPDPVPWKHWFGGAGAFLGLTVFAAWSTPLLSDNVVTRRPLPARSFATLHTAVEHAISALLPLPDGLTSPSWWPTAGRENPAVGWAMAHPRLSAILVVAILAGLLWSFRKVPLIAIGLVVGLALTEFLLLMSGRASIRNTGFLVLCLLAAIILLAMEAPQLLEPRLTRAILVITLTPALVCNLFIIPRELTTQFSRSREAANLITQRNLDRFPLATLDPWYSSPVAMYLNRRPFAPAYERLMGHNIWDQAYKPFPYVKPNKRRTRELIHSISEYAVAKLSPVIVISKDPLPTSPDSQSEGMKFVSCFHSETGPRTMGDYCIFQYNPW